MISNDNGRPPITTQVCEEDSSDGRPIAVFDLDGTLIDSMPTVFRLLGIVLGVAQPSSTVPALAEALKEYLGPPEETIIGLHLGASDVDWYVKEYLLYLESLRLDDARSFANDILDQAEECGFGIAVLTNKSTVLASETLKVLDIANRCEVVVDGYCHEGPKPLPGGLLRAIAEVGGSRSKSMLIGDTNTDRATAFSARVRFARACWFGDPGIGTVFRDDTTQYIEHEEIYDPGELRGVFRSICS
ncbi:MAG: HAD family hydrolase [Ferrimicrobium sp.]